jgi:hypothetical protein
MDNELHQVVPDNERGSQAVDKLASVSLRDGTESWLLLHSVWQQVQEIEEEQQHGLPDLPGATWPRRELA